MQDGCQSEAECAKQARLRDIYSPGLVRPRPPKEGRLVISSSVNTKKNINVYCEDKLSQLETFVNFQQPFVSGTNRCGL